MIKWLNNQLSRNPKDTTIRLTILAMTGLHPLIPTGPGIVLAGLLQYLGLHGFAGDIYVGPAPCTNTGPFAENFRVHSWKAHGSPLRRLISYAWFWLTCLLSVMRNDLVLFNSPPIGLGSAVLLAAGVARRPSVWIVHGGIFMERSQAGCAPRWLVRAISRRVTGLIAVSRAMADITARETRRSPLVIPNALPGSTVTPPRSDIEHDRVFVYLGRLVSIKRPDLLLQAFGRVAAQAPRSRLRLIGDGPNMPALKMMADRLGLAQRVEFCGFLEGEAKTHALEASDVLVVPSDFESFGMVILEAWERGLAVIASSTGGIPDIISHGITGMLFEPGDSADLAACMLKLCDNTLYSHLAIRGQNELLTRFSWDQSGSQYERLMRGILAVGKTAAIQHIASVN
jgi:glycogen(starch) synthase